MGKGGREEISHAAELPFVSKQVQALRPAGLKEEITILILLSPNPSGQVPGTMRVPWTGAHGVPGWPCVPKSQEKGNQTEGPGVEWSS